MKKILFATTALVATAGAASAEIALTGSAEIGILGGGMYGDVTQFHTDIDVTFTMTGEADNGLTFGAKVDLDENGAFGNTTQGGETYFVAYGGARLDMGDVDGAFDAAMTETNVAAGSIDDSETTHWGFNGNAGLDGSYDGQIATFSYTASGFSGYLSTEIDDAGVFDPVWGLGFKYSGDLGGTALTVGIGYQSGDQAAANASAALGFAAALAYVPAPGESAGVTLNNTVAAYETASALLTGSGPLRSEVMGVSVKADMANGLSFALNYSEAKYADIAPLDETESHWGIGLGYTQNALAIGVNYGEYDDRYGIDGLQDKGYGLAVAYDLGGGLAAQLGYGHSELSSGGVSFDTDSYSLGLAMSF